MLIYGVKVMPSQFKGAMSEFDRERMQEAQERHSIPRLIFEGMCRKVIEASGEIWPGYECLESAHSDLICRWFCLSMPDERKAMRNLVQEELESPQGGLF